MNMISIEQLEKRYGEQKVLDRITARFEGSVIYGLVGPNGCGKTTLMRCICGFTRPTAGTVRVLGKQLGKDCDFAPSTGIIIEHPGFLPHYSARRNLAILAGISGKVDKTRVDEVIRLAGLDPNDKKSVGKYSLGMRQRLGLALALIARPRLLVLDEPTNGLDPIGIEELRDQIRGFAAAGTTVIVSSHILSEVQQMADTIGIIYGGRLAYEDALRSGQDLEELFMSVCREGRRASGEVAA